MSSLELEYSISCMALGYSMTWTNKVLHPKQVSRTYFVESDTTFTEIQTIKVQYPISFPRTKIFWKIFHVSQSILSRCSNCVVSTELCSSLLPNVSEPWYSNLIYWFVNSNYNVSHPVVKIANYTTFIGSFTAKWGRRRGDRGVEGGGGKVEESLLHTPTLSPFVALVERETALINSKSVVLWNEFQEWFVS